MWVGKRGGQSTSLTFNFEPSPISQDEFHPVNEEGVIDRFFAWANDAEKISLVPIWSGTVDPGYDALVCEPLLPNMWKPLRDSSDTKLMRLLESQWKNAEVFIED